MEIKAKLNMTEKEQLKYYFYDYRKVMIWLPLFAFVFGVCFNIAEQKMKAFAPQGIDVLALLHEGLDAMMGMTISVLFFTLITAILMRRSNAFDGENTDCIFSDAGFRIESKTGAVSVSYGKIFKIGETKKAFYVSPVLGHGFVVSKRRFENQEDVQRVKELLKKNMDKKKLSLMKTKDE